MYRANPIELPFLQVAVILSLLVLLVGCAGLPRPLDTSRLFNVKEVQVTAQNRKDAGLAKSLKSRLQATAGRPIDGIGINTRLQITVLDQSGEKGLKAFINRSSTTLALKIDLIDVNTGRILRSTSLKRTSKRQDGDIPQAQLIETLVADVRALLGLATLDS